VAGFQSQQHSASVPATLAWVALVVYASAFPFSGWRWPAGASFVSLLVLPWPKWHDRFDLVANLLGYMPLGSLVAMAIVDVRGSTVRALATATCVAAGLSFGLEVMQVFLPQRVPSSLDWLLNALGGLIGAVIGVTLQRTGVVHNLQLTRERWFGHGGPGGLTLLMLWPVGLLFPTPVPLGLGQVWERMRDMVSDALIGVSWAEDAVRWFDPGVGDVARLSPLAETLAVGLGLLGPCLTAYCISNPGARRLVLALGAAVLAIGVTTLSTALNFGPQHALAWCTPTSLGGMGLGLMFALLLSGCGRRLAAGLALVVVTATTALVAQAPADPYFAESLHSWEQGRFIRFHGLAQWIGWSWPYIAIIWLLTRTGVRE
jgi:VanZ family protein